MVINPLAKKTCFPRKCYIKRCFTSKNLKRLFQLYNLQQRHISFTQSKTYSNSVLFATKNAINSLWVTLPPNNRHQGFIKIVQIWHRGVQTGIVQSSNQTISRDRHGSNDLSIQFFYYIKVRGLGWPLDGGFVLLLKPTVAWDGALSC